MPPDASGTIYLPENDERKLLGRAMELIEQCNESQSVRAAYARRLYQVSQTGRSDGTRSKINLLMPVLDLISSHLFSPTDLQFTIDFEQFYPKNITDRGKVVSRILTREWERTNADMMFAQGVFEALRYGSAFIKQWVQQESEDKHPVYYQSLVMPWQLGVTNERKNNLYEQDAICETFTLTMPEVWRRIAHLPNAEALFAKIRANARRGEAGDEQSAFFHAVFSTAQLNTGVQQGMQPQPGGIVQLNNDPNYAIIGPQVSVDVVRMHELWVRGPKDWQTIQVIDPGILVAPRPGFAPSNLLISGQHHTGLHPYTRICANDPHGYVWGRSELTDIIEPQGMVSQWADDISRLLGVQFDKIMAFKGDGLTDEQYADFRNASYVNVGAGDEVQDLTPAMPPNAIELLQFAMQIVKQISGFDNIIGGEAQSGVRSAQHGELLKQMASPRLRDRSLLLERQCAQAADLRLSIMEAKDERNYHTDGTSVETMAATKFNLADLPDDRRVAVDSHSSSPVFRTEHAQLIAWGKGQGIVDGEYVLDNMDFPNKDEAKARLKAHEAQQAELIKQAVARDPEALTKLLAHGGGHKR